MQTDRAGVEDSLKLWSWLNPFVAFIRRTRVAIVTLAVVISAVSLWTTSSNTINSNPFRYFDDSFWLRQSSDFAEQHLSGSQGIELIVDAGREDGIKEPDFLKNVESLQSWIDTIPGVVKTVSVIDFIKQTNKSFHDDNEASYVLPSTKQQIAELLVLYTFNLPQGLDLSNRVSLENDKLRISIRWTLYDSLAATEMAQKIEQKAAEFGLITETTGKMLLMQRMNNYVSVSLLLSIGLAVVFISLFLMVVFRSVKLGIIALVTNMLPLSLGFAILTISGRDIDTGAVVVLSACLGIAVDDTIHLFQAIRDGEHLDLETAIARGIRKVLPALGLTTLILVIGFGAFMLGDFVPNQNFGLMAVTILSAALLFDVTVLPALILMFFGNAMRVSEPMRHEAISADE